jgi:hypothetical protein
LALPEAAPADSILNWFTHKTIQLISRQYLLLSETLGFKGVRRKLELCVRFKRHVYLRTVDLVRQHQQNLKKRAGLIPGFFLTNKTERPKKTLLKVALNSINETKPKPKPFIIICFKYFYGLHSFVHITAIFL